MKRHALILLSSLAVSACGGSASTGPASGSAGGEAAPDPLASLLPPAPASTAAAQAPRELIGVIRAGAVDSTLERALGLLRTADSAPRDEQLRQLVGSAELAAQISPTSGMELAIVHVADEPDIVQAFDGPPMRTLVGALVDSTRTEPQADGSLRVFDHPGDEDTIECFVQPTSRATRTRIVCSDDARALELSRAYLATNFAEPIEAAHLRFELAVDSLRARYASDARSGLMVAGAMTNALLVRASTDEDVPAAARMLLQNAGVRAKIEVLARDVFDDLGSFIADVSSFHVNARIDADSVHFEADLRIPAATGSMQRALGTAFRGTNAVSDELIARLPPGGALYAAGEWDGTTTEEISREVRDLVSAIVASDERVSTAERDRFERVLAVAMRPEKYSYATMSGMEQNAEPFSVSVIRLADAAAVRARIDAMKQLAATIRRPAIARAFDRYFESLGADRPRFSQVADARVSGVPSGSYAARFPAFEQLVSRILSESLDIALPERPSSTNRTVLFVPSQADLIVIQAKDVASVYRGLASAGGLAPEVRTALAESGWAMNAAVRLGNVRIRDSEANHESGARTLESILGTEAGQAVSVMRLRDSGVSDDLHFEWSADVPGVVVRALAALPGR